MIFNSVNFLIFFAIVFFLYYFPLKEKTKAQNWLLLIASYVFYGIADWRMIPLLLVATTVFYGLGIAIQKSTEKKSSLLTTLGVLLGVGLLVYFKYLNFFIESFSDLFNAIGLKTNWSTFNIILPLGISFFTFKLISYVIEVHRENIEPTNDFVVFATYIAFFPTILSGPIDRPNKFIPQLKSKRPFNYDMAIDGARQILWGMFKKMVIADNISLVVDEIWQFQDTFTSSTLVLGAVLYSFQMYADFSGYSDMAIGVGKLLGFRITKNFNYPFFAKNIAEFWRNWHISLTSWLTDYVFMPLNFTFRRWRQWGSVLAIIITFVLVGLWHGSNLTFSIFGLYHGLLYIPLMLSGAFSRGQKLRVNKLGLPVITDFLKILGTFLLVTLGMIIFRADNIAHAYKYVCNLFSTSLFSIPKILGFSNVTMLLSIVFIIIMLVYEWRNRDKEYGLEISHKKIGWQFTNYAFILFFIYYFSATDTSSFIYFQF